MSRQLIGTRAAGRVTEYAGVSGYKFDRGGTLLVQIVWSTDGTDQMIDRSAGFVGAYDKYCDPLTPDAGQLTVGWSPIYIELEQDAAK